MGADSPTPGCSSSRTSPTSSSCCRRACGTPGSRWSRRPPGRTRRKLLRYFMGNANRVLSKMQILDHVWDYDFRGDTGIVESYVSVLRRKVDSTDPHLLHTLRGVGYVLRLPST